jgi:S-DNA-T family DNA segregation ATPase FtsK/SpoIIIE
MEYLMGFAGSEISTSGDIDRRRYEAMAFDGGVSKTANMASHLGVLVGLVILVLVVVAFIALATWSVNDPSLSNANGKIATNWMGFWGASFADIMIQFLGLGAAIFLFPPAVIGWLKLLRQTIAGMRKRLICWPLMAVLASAAIACFSAPDGWPLPSGLGGFVGDLFVNIPTLFTGEPLTGWLAAIMFTAFGVPALVLALYSGGLINRNPVGQDDLSDLERDEADEDDDSVLAFGAFTHWYLSIKSRFHRKRRHQAACQQPVDGHEVEAAPGLFNRLKKRFGRLIAATDDGPGNIHDLNRHEPDIGESFSPSMPEYGEHIYDAVGDELASELHAEFIDGQLADEPDQYPNQEMGDDHDDGSAASSLQRVQPMAPRPKQSARVTREAQGSMFGAGKFELPSLHFLGLPKNIISNAGLSSEELEQNARLLEGVLGDFGVKGEIINVRPGPVVTLYELEPAPGIKSSRVIGLADDIARSMSAIAARVAVVSGRNVIGIELPNQRRETVYLREVLASQVYEKSKAKLPIILGKNIGGEPIIADLAKMPHLLVAGTTGSGKSVAINTMILSILYRLTPDQVKMIMIDPKMLELSIYDGIPHLLTPVVTDPKKAVVALKWTVREMEERYKAMSKLGVRNIDGFNSRLAQAVQKKEVLTKTVQTGFDRETGEAIYQTEELDLNPMPYIVVVIDEMADLMMVAGKDIEGTVQRLAQMARAAGIHVVMATQRPSVDVITGTIKANFPTRISFQVTSKIDSRTILGEQGAEQLLGMGDMLYQAGGGRISRVHGPFVDEDEVEKVVNHLKTQGTPEYLDSVTEDDEEEMGVDGDAGDLSESADIYDQAVSIVLRDRKVSTSYIQRRLSIGYNRAATLIERMEQEGLISSANHAGKREILVPAEDETL